MVKEAKVKMVHFSTPYRAGMENEPGYLGKAEMVQKGYPSEKVFAKWGFPLDATIKIDDATALAFGRETLQMNSQRGPAIAKKLGDYKIAGPSGTVAGGITKTDKNQIKAMGSPELWLGKPPDLARIVKAFKIGSGKDISVDEVKEILAV